MTGPMAGDPPPTLTPKDEARIRCHVETLVEHFPPCDSDLVQVDGRALHEFRYVAIARNSRDGDYFFSGHDALEDAFGYLGGEVLDGWLPEAVFDIFEGKRIDLHVSDPVVSKSEVQGATENVLAPNTEAPA